MSKLPSRADQSLVEVLSSLPRIDTTVSDPKALLSRAEVHGVAGVVFPALRSTDLTPSLARELHLRQSARQLDFEAHLDLLSRIDAVFEEHGIEAVALKGPLLAERLYDSPSARPTSDVDLLVREADLDRAVEALRALGYEITTNPWEREFRREHHHLSLVRPNAILIELHFHAYRGLGTILRSEPLFANRVARAPFRAIGVLSLEDELVFLSVHGTAHRFVRLGWLYDVRLLTEKMTREQLTRASQRAADWGFASALAFTAKLLIDVFGASPDHLAPLGRLGRWRGSLVSHVAAEPEHALARAATRFVYTTALCDTLGAAASHAMTMSASFVRRRMRATRPLG